MTAISPMTSNAITTISRKRFENQITPYLDIPEHLRSFNAYATSYVEKERHKGFNLNLKDVKKIKSVQNQFNIDKSRYTTKIDKLYDLYINSASSENLRHVVLGGSELRFNNESLVILNFGTISEECAIRGPVKRRIEQFKGGVLCESNWNILKNDIFMMGAIHAKKIFHIHKCESKIPISLLWDNRENRPRALGREILTLLENGYKIHKHSFTGIGLEPSEEDSVNPLTRIALKNLYCDIEKKYTRKENLISAIGLDNISMPRPRAAPARARKISARPRRSPGRRSIRNKK